MTRTGRPKLALKVQHGVEELKAAYRGATDAVEKRRIQAIWLLAAGKSRAEVREVTAYAPASLVMIIRRYNQDGLIGLNDKRHNNPGLAPLLDEAERKALYTALQAPPEEGGVWSGKKVATWVGQHLGKTMCVQRGCEYLERLGFSLQHPRPQHVQADLAAQADFKETRSPNG